MGDGRRVAVVTGAASGIGRATAVRLAAEGCSVACLDLDLAGARATVEAIAASAGSAGSAGSAVGAGVTGWAHQLDVRDEAAVHATVGEVAEVAGGIDVLVNAAGIVFYRALADTTAADLERILAVNLVGTYSMCRAAAPHLSARRGAIVNVASAAGLNGRAYLTAYSASKGAVVALTRSLAVELAPEVRANAVCPSAVDTPMVAGVTLPEGIDASKLARHPMLLGHMATAEQIAAAIAFLASAESGTTTGAVLAIDGGAGA